MRRAGYLCAQLAGGRRGTVRSEPILESLQKSVVGLPRIVQQGMPDKPSRTVVPRCDLLAKMGAQRLPTHGSRVTVSQSNILWQA